MSRERVDYGTARLLRGCDSTSDVEDVFATLDLYVVSAAEKAVLEACSKVIIRNGLSGCVMSYECANRVAEAEQNRRDEARAAGKRNGETG